MPLYDCPECGAKIKTAKEKEPGQKIRCPKCENVFAPVGAGRAAAAKKKAAPAPVALAKTGGDDDEGGSYGVIRNDEEEAKHVKDREKIFDPVKDRFERSARGPALVHVVRPSDWLLRNGVLTCIAAIVGILMSIWPMVFRVEEVQPVDPKKHVNYSEQGKKRYKVMTAEEYQTRFIWAGAYVGQFLIGAVIAAGAAKMHELEMYPLAMTGAILALFVGPGTGYAVYAIKEYSGGKEPDPTQLISAIIAMIIGLPFSTWALRVLRKQEVIDGFYDEKPEG